MTALGLHGDVSIRRLRVHDGGADRLAVELRTRRTVGGAALRPPGLPPAAVLLVRALADPLPRALRLDEDRAPHAWQAAVAERLANVARTAARPAAGPVGVSTTAVLFEDTATMLACLARDDADGVMAERWWWRLLARPLGGGRLDVVEALASAPEEVPAVFELLAARHEAARVAAALGEPGAVRVLGAMQVAHGVATAGAAQPAATGDAPPRAESAAEPPQRLLVRAPWASVAPEAELTPLAPAARELVGTALLLRRRPAMARAAPFAAAVERWSASLRAPERRADTRPPPPAAETRPAPGRQLAAAPAQPFAPPAPGLPAAPAVPEPADARPVAPDVSPPAERGVPATQPDAVPERTSVRATPAETATETAAPATTGTPVTTELGGLFYLLNAALALDLYGDFTAPLGPQIALDPWDFVALVGARLLPAPRPAEPVWELLATLAGRPPGRSPGAGLAAPAAWRVPAAWLDPFGAAPLAVARPARERLVLRHPAGFAAVDVSRHGRLGPQLRHERARRPPALAAGPVPAGARTLRRRPLQRWVDWVADYLRARLGPVLGVLLAHDAAVHVTPTHVDVVLALAELPLEIRFAGLDRTPGWIPAAGRHLAFHFE